MRGGGQQAARQGIPRVRQRRGIALTVQKREQSARQPCLCDYYTCNLKFVVLLYRKWLRKLAHRLRNIFTIYYYV